MVLKERVGRENTGVKIFEGRGKYHEHTPFDMEERKFHLGWWRPRGEDGKGILQPQVVYIREYRKKEDREKQSCICTVYEFVEFVLLGLRRNQDIIEKSQ